MWRGKPDLTLSWVRCSPDTTRRFRSGSAAENDFFVHQTSIIDRGVKIGKGTKIWHWSHVSSNSKIGKNSTLGQGCFVGNNVKIGNNCKIQNNVSIFDGVTIEDGVFVGPSTTCTNIKNPRSLINQKNKFIKTIVKKGVSIGANSTIICGIKLGEYSLIGAGSVVTKNVKKYNLVYGNPAEIKGLVDKKGKKKL